MTTTPKISLDTLSEKELEIYHKLDNELYGKPLAQQVVTKLKKPKYEGWGLFHSHRDYCGLGLCFYENTYQLGIVNDGFMPPLPVLISFEKETDFVKWLSSENDQSMALYGEKFNNQTITRTRLQWFLEDNYSPVWNEYCLYLRKQN